MKLINPVLFTLAILFITCVQSQNFQDRPGNEPDDDFPKKWDLIKGSAQINTFQDEKVISLSNGAIITPLLSSKNYLADSFKLEFDAYFDVVRNGPTEQHYSVRFWDGNARITFENNRGKGWYDAIKIFRHGAYLYGYDESNNRNIAQNVFNNDPAQKKEAIWRSIAIHYNKGSLKVFIDGNQIINVPKYKFNPTIISIGAEAAEYGVAFIRAIKNIQLENDDNLNTSTENEGNSSSSISFSDDSEDGVAVIDEQINAISANEDGLISVLSSDALTSSGLPLNPTIIDDIIYEEMIRQNLPGLAIGVYQKGVINYTKGYGHIDLDRTIPITSKTSLRWASISKTLTAVATLILEQKSSAFSIDDTVVEHYPYWTSDIGLQQIPHKSDKENITIKQLLTNMSGINGYTRSVWDNEDNYSTDRDGFNANSAIDVFRNDSLRFSPGRMYFYSTQGFNLVGAVIDEVYANGYPTFIKKYIADKLGMTTLKISNSSMPGFQKERDGVINSQQVASKEWVLPGGGWESNVEDLLRVF